MEHIGSHTRAYQFTSHQLCMGPAQCAIFNPESISALHIGEFVFDCCSIQEHLRWQCPREPREPREQRFHGFPSKELTV